MIEKKNYLDYESHAKGGHSRKGSSKDIIVFKTSSDNSQNNNQQHVSKLSLTSINVESQYGSSDPDQKKAGTDVCNTSSSAHNAHNDYADQEITPTDRDHKKDEVVESTEEEQI